MFAGVTVALQCLISESTHEHTIKLNECFKHEMTQQTLTLHFERTTAVEISLQNKQDTSFPWTTLQVHFCQFSYLRQVEIGPTSFDPGMLSSN